MNPITALLLGLGCGAFIGMGIMALASIRGYEDGYRQAIMDMKHKQKR